MPDSVDIQPTSFSALVRGLAIGQSHAIAKRFILSEIFDRGDISGWTRKTRDRVNPIIARAGNRYTVEVLTSLNGECDALLAAVVITRIA